MAAHDQPVGPLTALLDMLADTATPLFTRDGTLLVLNGYPAHTFSLIRTYSSTTRTERRAVTAAGSELIGLIVTLLLHHIRHLAGVDSGDDGGNWRYAALWSLVASSTHLTRPHISITTMPAHYPDVSAYILLYIVINTYEQVAVRCRVWVRSVLLHSKLSVYLRSLGGDHGKLEEYYDGL